MTRMANVMLIFSDQNRPRAEPPKIPPVILKLRMRVSVTLIVLRIALVPYAVQLIVPR